MTNDTGAMSVEAVLTDLTIAERAAMAIMLQQARDNAQVSGLHRVAHAWHAFGALLVLSQESENDTLAAMEQGLRP